MIKILTGYLQPDEGSVHVNGLDVLVDTADVQAQIGYLPENAPLYQELSIQSYLRMVADLREIPEEDQTRLISEAVYATGLDRHLTRPIGALSKGFRQRVGLAQSILHRPALLILDEPTIGLDPTQIVEIRRLIRRLSGHSTILFSTHILSEVEALCDRAIILINGQIRADAHLADLAATSGAVLVLDRPAQGVADSLQQLSDVRHVDGFETSAGYPAYRVAATAATGGALCPAIYDMARQQSWPLRELRQDRRTLESVFNELATTATPETTDAMTTEVIE